MPLSLTAKQLQDSMNKYKTGFNLAPTNTKEDRTKSQKLSRKKEILVQNTSDKLLSGMQTICPITGLVFSVDFPAKPGFYLEAHHPIVHNCKAMVKDSTYTPLLDREQKAGLILASLEFYGLLSLESPALVVNMAIQASLNDNQLDQFISFIRDGVSCTNKGYPIFSANAQANEQTFLSYMAKCDEIEHTDYSVLNLESADELTKKLFTIPKFLASDKRGSSMDKEAHELFLDLISLDLLPSSLIASTKPFIKSLITNPSHSIIAKLLIAVEAKYDAGLNSDETAEAAVQEFTTFVRISRETAEKLKIYPDLSAPLFEPELESGTSLVESGRPAPLPTEKTVEATNEPKVMSPFEARMAALKAKGGI